MATRQACQRVLLRRISPRGIAAPASVSISACAARTCSGVAARPLARWTSPRSVGGVAGVRRWYSGPDNQVPNSRIWGFDEIKKLVEGKDPKEEVVIVDVREPHELLDTGKIPGAINIPITSAVQSFHISDEDFEDLYGYARPPKDASLLFYCKAGVRARAAAGLAQHAGWASVGEYPGSWLDWDLNKGPVEAVKPGGSKGDGK
ncbi:rhodanese-like domain-containing protein [Trichoderma breve]|uniref:Rhodanese-like domain-containing protein n=1 Tax=Trichoderma breve TaxID=2034170 RepID=A0A9W9JRD5_9HYPO|nr:rhodanese-like domain-containing protein [Trichoderma breve]KAJ4864541.1 rhodanese-like domain-containing protein [Trichoderma breve]